MSMKNSKYTSGNRTRDLLTCNSVPICGKFLNLYSDDMLLEYRTADCISPKKMWWYFLVSAGQ